MDIVTLKENLNRLKFLLSQPSTDVCWSSYNTSSEVIYDLETVENGVLNNEEKSVDRLILLLAPTGALQEISISSGWGEEFLGIAEAIENAVNNSI